MRLKLTAPALLAVAFLSCAPAIHSAGMQDVVTERLYFGRNIGTALGVTDSAWAVFINEVVSPRLPKGFTFWAAEGDWLGFDRARWQYSKERQPARRLTRA